MTLRAPLGPKPGRHTNYLRPLRSGIRTNFIYDHSNYSGARLAHLISVIVYGVSKTYLRMTLDSRSKSCCKTIQQVSLHRRLLCSVDIMLSWYHENEIINTIVELET